MWEWMVYNSLNLSDNSILSYPNYWKNGEYLKFSLSAYIYSNSTHSPSTEAWWEMPYVQLAMLNK